MAVSVNAIRILATALSVVVGLAIVLGHRFHDKGSKYDDPSKIQELNVIRIMIRSEKTVTSIENIWNYLYEVKEQMKKDGIKFSVSGLFFDTQRRHRFNSEINALENAIHDSDEIAIIYKQLKIKYLRIGLLFYIFAIILGFIGYGLLFCSLPEVDIFTNEVLNNIFYSSCVIVIVYSFYLLHYYDGIRININKYNKTQTQYLIGGVRL